MRSLAIFLGFALSALGCECQRATVCELINAPTIFIGEVVDGGVSSIKEDPWYSTATHVRLKVLENFRGLPAKTQFVDIDLSPAHGRCSPNPYFPGKQYLVRPSKQQGKFWDGICFGAINLETGAETVRQVREYFKGEMPLNIRGRIAAARNGILDEGGSNSIIDFILDWYGAKPLAGVRVSTFRNGKVYSTLTGADGRYALNLPDSGHYKLHTAFATYESSLKVEVDLPSKGCAVQNFGMIAHSSISGTVWNTEGKPMKDAPVWLFDLDHPVPALASSGHFHEQSDMGLMHKNRGFIFSNVPIGRYLLMYNPGGPDAQESPFESTYYPLASDRSTAKVIEVTSDNVHLTGMDLVVGQRTEFRRVSIQIQFPDGSPMKTAHVHCIGSASKQGEMPWIFNKGYPSTDTIQFSAPANRKLRIEVSDGYGRKLKATYASTHEPGNTPITEKFVVTP